MIDKNNNGFYTLLTILLSIITLLGILVFILMWIVMIKKLEE